MRPEVVSVVRDLARAKRTRFRASFVAEEAGVPVEDARRNLVKLADVGDLQMNFELLSPFDDSTVATFSSRDRIPTVFASDDSGHGEEFEVTPDLIWVTFSPTDNLVAEVEREHESPSRTGVDEGDPPGNQSRPRREPPARASTSSQRTPTAQLAHH